MDAPEIIFVVIIGLVLGSFATALSWRLPRGISIGGVRRSRCSSCQHDLGVPDLVPVLSWAFLRGKCRHCRAKISWRYPLIELATLGLCLLFYAVYGLRAETAAVFLLAPVLVSIIDIDLHHKIIPDSLNLAVLLTGAVLLLIHAVTGGNPVAALIGRGGDALAGMLIYGLGSLLLRQVMMRIMRREPMGLGDVKFYAVAGFWLGLDPDAASVFLLVSGFSGVVIALIWKRATGQAEVPFGPSLILAFIAAVCSYPPGFILA